MMTSMYTEEELTDLLRRKSPQEIRTQDGDRLDAAGHALLAAREAAPDVEDLLREAARHERALTADLPPIPPPPPAARPGLRDVLSWLQWPAAALGAVCTVLVFQALLLPPTSGLGGRGTWPVQRLRDVHGVDAVNQELARALRTRAAFFAEKGMAADNPDYLAEAVMDLEQAFALAPDEATRQKILDLQARIEALDNAP